MPPRGKASDVVRLVLGKRGTVAIRTELIIRFGYGSFVRGLVRRDLTTPAVKQGIDHFAVDVKLHLAGGCISDAHRLGNDITSRAIGGDA